MNKLRSTIRFLGFQPTREAFREYGRRLRPVLSVLISSDVYTLASAIATCAILSFFPFTILLISILQKFPNSEETLGVVRQLLIDYMPYRGVDIANSIAERPSRFGTLQFASAAILILSATGVFIPIEVALNRMWNAPRNLSFLKNQLVSIGVILLCGVLALCTFFIGGAFRFVLEKLPLHRLTDVLLYVSLKALGFSLSIAVFFIIFRLLPNVRLSLDKTIRVAVFTGVFWEAGKHVFIRALPHLELDKIYGGSKATFTPAVVLILWSYVSAMIMLIGADLVHRDLLSLELFRGAYAQWNATARISPRPEA